MGDFLHFETRKGYEVNWFDSLGVTGKYIWKN